MMDDLYWIADTVALLAVIVITLLRLNEMSAHSTRLPLRAAYVWLAIGAFASLIDDFSNWQSALLHLGIAAVLLADSRKAHCWEPDRECFK